MATVNLADLEQYGIDLSTVLKAMGPKKVTNKRDGTIEIENHDLKQVVEAVRYFRSLEKGSNPSSLFGRLGFGQVKSPNANGKHNL
jgi:hypothetical protein